jgi:hypothetical protein
LIDSIVINQQAYECSSRVLDFGYSDHLAQIININVNKLQRGPAKSRKRHFPKKVLMSLSTYYRNNHGRSVFYI